MTLLLGAAVALDETKHSPEPWRVVEPDPGKGERWEPGVDDGNGDAVLWDGIQTEGGDLRRIVACVNACAGIPTAALEAGRLGQLFAQALAVVQIVAAGMPYCGLVVHAEDLGPTLRALGKLAGPGVSGKDGP